MDMLEAIARADAEALVRDHPDRAALVEALTRLLLALLRCGVEVYERR